MTTEQKQEFAKEIHEFLKKYAKIGANYDPTTDDEAERFNGPDSTMLYCFAIGLERDYIAERCWSDYDQGCYERTDEGRIWHKSIMDRVYVLINKR